jgi:hypothetical protein
MAVYCVFNYILLQPQAPHYGQVVLQKIPDHGWFPGRLRRCLNPGTRRGDLLIRFAVLLPCATVQYASLTDSGQCGVECQLCY